MHHQTPRHIDEAEKPFWISYSDLMTALMILFLVVTWIPRNHMLLATTPWYVFFAAIGLGVFGMVLGYALARLLKQDPNRSRTIALETGIQNGPLAILIVTLSFAGSMQQDILLIPVLYSLFIVISSSFVTMVFRRRSDREALARDKAKAGQLVSA